MAAQVEVQWNVELPVSLFEQASRAFKAADAVLLQSNQPLCLRFQLQSHAQTPATCEVQLRSDDVHEGGEPDIGFPQCSDGYICQVSMEGGRVRSSLQKIQETQVVGTLESSLLALGTPTSGGDISFWIVLGPGAIIVGVGEMGEQVIQGSFDELPIPVQSIVYSRLGEEQQMQLSSVWIGTLLVRGPDPEKAAEDDDTLQRAFNDYKTAFQKAHDRAQRFNVEFQPPPLRMIANNGTQALTTGRKRGERHQAAAPISAKHKQSNKRTLSSMSTDATEHKMDWDLIRRLPDLSIDRIDPTDLELEQPGSDLHLFFLDEATGIRSKDLLRFFTDFAPRWIYWLGDRACNVFFHEPAEAQRAWEALAVDIPNVPNTVAEEIDASVSQRLSELQWRGWKLGRKPVRKLVQDKYGRKGSRARFIVRHTLASDVREREMNAQEDEDADNEVESHLPAHVHDDDDDIEQEDAYLYADVSEAEYFRAFSASKRNRRAIATQAAGGSDQTRGFAVLEPLQSVPDRSSESTTHAEVKMELGGFS